LDKWLANRDERIKNAEDRIMTGSWRLWRGSRKRCWTFVKGVRRSSQVASCDGIRKRDECPVVDGFWRSRTSLWPGGL